MNHKMIVSLVGFFVMLNLSVPAHAYIDPATGSILLQAAIGAVAGVTLFMRTSLSKVKSLFTRQKARDDR